MNFKNGLSCILSLSSAFLLLSGAMHAQARPALSDPLNARASSRIAGAIDEDSLHPLPGNRHPLARPEFDVGAVAAATPMERMVLVLNPSTDQQTALESLISAQRDPTSPHYRQWLTPSDFAEHYGASAEDVQRIVSWLESRGMRIEEVAPSRRTITFSGTAAQVERAFATTMRTYRVNGRLHIANATDPQIPRALSSVVHGVLSLHDFQSNTMNVAVAKPAPQLTSGGGHYVTPGDLATIYNVNPLYTQGITGSGTSVAVVARSDIYLSDIRAFRSMFGLPANDPQIIVNGADPGIPDQGDQMEATLDAEYAGALARNATVKFVTSASTSSSDGVYLSAQYIVNQNLAQVMTTSFGVCEAQLGSSGLAFINSLWQQAAAQGITVLVSSGDSGVAGCDNSSSSKAVNGAGVNGLCSTPYSTCVGGTEFNDTANPSLYWSSTNASGSQASALSYIPEGVWNESGSSLWAGGGGKSIVYSKPSWQSAPGVPADGVRDVPDVSLTAAGHDGYLIVLDGSQYVVGGTSAASPSLASILALVVQSTGARQGNVNPTLYSLAKQESGSSNTVFHDVTTGNNSVPGLAGYSATSGYDLATGLGSVNASALVTNWHSGQTTPKIQVTLSKSSLTVAPSTTNPITVTIAGIGAASTLTTTGLAKGITATFTPSTIASPGSGSSTLQIVVASSTAAGTYSFNVVATSGTNTSTAVVSITVLAPSLTFSSSATAVTMLAGTRQTVTLTATGNATLNSAVSLKCVGIPAGVTATFSPSSIAAPGSGSSLLTLVAASNAVSGSYVVSATATAGTLSKTVQFPLNIPSLSVSTNTASLSLARGSSVSVVITTKITGGFNSAADIAVSGLPSGVTATLAKTAIAAPGAGTVSISFAANTTATLGAAKVSVTATGGGLAATVPISLTVAPQPTFTFSTTASSTSPMNVSGLSVIKFTSAAQNGFTSALSLSATGGPTGATLKLSSSTITPGQSVNLTITPGKATTAGTSSVTVTATGGGQSKALTVPLNVPK